MFSEMSTPQRLPRAPERLEEHAVVTAELDDARWPITVVQHVAYSRKCATSGGIVLDENE